MLKMVEKWLHISCKRFSRYILTKIAKIGKFALYSFIYLQVVPAFNGVGQVTRNIIKPTFISFPVKSWGSELTHLATHTSISNPSQLQASLVLFIALQPCQKLGIILENEVFQKLKGSCTGRWNVWSRWFLAGNQGSHQNFVPSLTSKNLWQIFVEMKQIFFKVQNSRLKKIEFFKIANFQKIFARRLVLGSIGLIDAKGIDFS